MADDEKKELSEKEKEVAQQNEKDQDTNQGKASTPGSAKSKPGSAKSGGGSNRSGSAKTPKDGKRPKSSTRASSPKEKTKKKGKKNKQEDDKADSKSVAIEDEGLPEGCVPLFLSSPTQEIFACRADEDVTTSEPFKYLNKEDITKDFYNRGAVSDFTPLKQLILDYPEDETILIVYDADFKFGQNFYIATTLEAKQKLLFVGGGGEGEPEEEEEEEEDIVYRYIPPEPKEWVSQGSHIDIEEESLRENRPKIRMSIKRIRREFGAPVEFEDRNVEDHVKQAYLECTSFEDKSFDLKRLELDKAIQAIPEFVDSTSQTDWKYPRNANTQYYPREFTEEEKQQQLESGELNEFAKNVLPRFELAMQQNEIMNVFFDDWMALADDDSSFGSKADNHLKEYQSFTDLQFSKDKTITCIDWHPTIRGVVAVSVAEKLSFDERIDNAARVIMTPSLILIWSFADPIHPQLLLEAPDDIYCFKFSPTDPNHIVGGCINGQVVLWDISAFSDRLKTQRGGNKKKSNLNTLPGFEDENAMDTPIVRYCAVSSIEHSHRAPITDIQWLPDHLEINRMGIPHENKSGQCVQLISCATDHSILVWDIRPPKQVNQVQQEKKKGEINNPMGVATTFKHLDLTWKPLLKVNLSKSEPGGDHAPTKFSIQERQGDRSVLGKEEGKDEKKDSTTAAPAPGGFGGFSNKPGSAHGKRTLPNVNTHFYAGTEDGEIVFVDWLPQKDQDTGKIQTPKPDYYHSLHDGPIVTLQRSPFFKDILLCAGGWTFAIWKEGVSTGPLLLSSASNKRLTAGHWSPTRPGVFYITRNDGSVDVWDLLDRTHEPSMTQSVSPVPITCLYPFQVTGKQHLLAVGDVSGTLHILEIPWSLRQPTTNEIAGVSNYFEREVKRRSYVVARWDFREKEKMEKEAEAKRLAGIAPNVQLSEDEVEFRMKLEFKQFQEEENAFLRNLGLLKDEEDLPPTD